jgi:hypothetical protein
VTPSYVKVKGPLPEVLGRVRRLSDPDMQAEIEASDRFLAELRADRHRDWLASLPPAQRESQERLDRFRTDAEADAAVVRLRDRRYRGELTRHRQAAEADRVIARLRRAGSAPARRDNSPAEFRRQLRLRGAR